MFDAQASSCSLQPGERTNESAKRDANRVATLAQQRQLRAGDDVIVVVVADDVPAVADQIDFDRSLHKNRIRTTNQQA